MTLVFFSTTTFTVAFTVQPAMCLGIGFCQLIISFIDDITNDVHVLNEFDPKMNECQSEMKNHFWNLVEDFSNVKQLSIYSNIETPPVN